MYTDDVFFDEAGQVQFIDRDGVASISWVNTTAGLVRRKSEIKMVNLLLL